MPIVTCPKCPTKLKVPDGATGAVKCPKCQTVFKPAAAASAAPAFEVVDEEAPSAKPSRPAPAPEPAPKKKVTARTDDDEDDDRPRKKRSRDDDDDDDDDRPRSKRRRDDDDDDDDDDRPRKKKKRRDDDDDNDYDRRGKGSSLGVARVGLLMLVISLGLYLGSLGLHLLFLFIAWLGGVIPNGLVLVTGILGLANWVTGLVGLGLSIGGPAKARGLAIAAICVAVVHLVLAFVVANDSKSAWFSSDSIRELSLLNRAERLNDLRKEAQKNPNGEAAKELKEEMATSRDDFCEDLEVVEVNGGARIRSKSQMRWGELATLQPFLDKLIAVISYQSKAGFENGWYLWGLFGGMTEVARLILICLVIGSLAGVAKVHGAADKAKFAWIGASAAAGVCMLVVILVAVIVEGNVESQRKRAATEQSLQPPPRPNTGNFQRDHEEAVRQQQEFAKQIQADAEKRAEKQRAEQRGNRAWGAMGELLVYLIHAGVLVLPALAALQVFSATGRRR